MFTYEIFLHLKEPLQKTPNFSILKIKLYLPSGRRNVCTKQCCYLW